MENLFDLSLLYSIALTLRLFINHLLCSSEAPCLSQMSEGFSSNMTVNPYVLWKIRLLCGIWCVRAQSRSISPCSSDPVVLVCLYIVLTENKVIFFLFENSRLIFWKCP